MTAQRKTFAPRVVAVMLVLVVAIPFLLDSTWAFAPVAFASIALIVRTALEDKTLQDELDGYRDYARQVRYRLFPGVW